MQKFASICALAASAAALQKGTSLMYIDTWEADVTMLPQGDGQDHTLWDWRTIEDNGNDKIRVYDDGCGRALEEIDRLQDLIDTFWQGMTSTEVTNQLSCELHRNEEINLYYQCTQGAFNNYALDHFGGDMRSYPRWIYEFKRCNLMLAEAEECKNLIQRDGIFYDCPPCTDITTPMPQPFGPGRVDPEPPKVCDPLPDLSMFSVFRPMYVKLGVDKLFKSQFQYWCLEQKTINEYEATLNIKMIGNAKTEPNYHIRLNQDDCTTIELKKYTDTEWIPGATLQPYGEPFTGYDAYYFMQSAGEMPEKYDSKVGYCICDSEDGVCEGFYSDEVAATIKE